MQSSDCRADDPFTVCGPRIWTVPQFRPCGSFGAVADPEANVAGARVGTAVGCVVGGTVGVPVGALVSDAVDSTGTVGATVAGAAVAVSTDVGTSVADDGLPHAASTRLSRAISEIGANGWTEATIRRMSILLSS